jgi:8-oxo-dGTP pyrophosphatase MutT (NUDIX family)
MQITELQHRFLINLPESEWKSWNRLWYHIELAYYFWLDHQLLASLSETTTEPEPIHLFCKDLLRGVLTNVQKDNILRILYQRYLYTYKYKIPVAGIVLRVKDRILLVLNRSSNKWGFPKGKLNRDEEAWDCAGREFQEETGLAIENTKATLVDTFLLDSGTARLIDSQRPNKSVTTLFYLRSDDVSVCDRILKPKCPKEIAECRWIDLKEVASLGSSATAMLQNVCRRLSR